MIRLFFTWTLLLTVTTVYSKLKCTKCPFRIEPEGPTNCTETCEGDVCYIVVNSFYNGTKIAGCINLYEGDKFNEGPAICYRQSYQTSCACTTGDFCNSPTAPIANFNFTEEPILNGYQLQPQIAGGPKPDGEMNPETLTIKPNENELNNENKPGDEHYAPTPNAVPMTSTPTTQLNPSEVVMTKKPSEEVIVTKFVNSSGTSERSTSTTNARKFTPIRFQRWSVDDDDEL